ncbi:MAG: sulfite exporter TauE/SafE family protein [Burkholderiaceae bacterium]|nr:sulfite exporter TauE/SafE family protein [Burkholderiaceae bacterium]
MLASLASTALLMGLAGGPHCLAMCAAPCSVVTGQATSQASGPTGEHPLHWMPRPADRWRRLLAYHSGRLLGYATAGALAAMAMQGLAWMTQHTAALRPVWTFMHVAMLAWGLMMLLQARQPAWVERAGRSVWGRVQPLVRAPGGVFVTGFLWALMPCGLLYSALLVAALSGGAWQGALSMALFGVGSGIWLLVGPWAWQNVRARMNGLRAQWGTRFAGLLLMVVACWALWMDLVYRPSLMCQ